MGSNIFAALEAYERELKTNLDALGAKTHGSKLQRSSNKLDRGNVTRATKDLPSLEELDADAELEALARDADANQSLQLSDIHKGFMKELGDGKDDLSEMVRSIQKSPTRHEAVNDDSDLGEDSIMDLDSDDVKMGSDGDSGLSARFASTGEYVPDNGASVDYEYSSFLKSGGPMSMLPAIAEDEEMESQPVQTSSPPSKFAEDATRQSGVDNPDSILSMSGPSRSPKQPESSGTNPSSVISASIGHSNQSCDRDDDQVDGALSLREGSSVGMVFKSGFEDQYEEDEEEEMDDKFAKILSKEKIQGGGDVPSSDANVLRDSDTGSPGKSSLLSEQKNDLDDDFVGSSFLSNTMPKDKMSAADMDSGEFIEMPSDPPMPGNGKEKEGGNLDDDFDTDVYNEPAEDLSASEFIEAPELSEKSATQLDDDFLDNDASKKEADDSLSGFIEMPSETNVSRNEQAADALDSSSTVQSKVDDGGDSGFIQLPSEQGTQLSDDFADNASVTAPENSASAFVELPSELVQNSVQGSIELPSEITGNSVQASIELPSEITGNSLQASIELPSEIAENSIQGSIELPSEKAENSVQGSIELPQDFESSMVNSRVAAQNSLDGSIELPLDSPSGDQAQVQSSLGVSGFIEAPSSTAASVVNDSISGDIELPSDSNSGSKKADSGLVQSSVYEFIDMPKDASQAVVDDDSEFIAAPSLSEPNSAIVESEAVSLSQATGTVNDLSASITDSKSNAKVESTFDDGVSGTIDLPSDKSSSGELVDSEPVSRDASRNGEVFDGSIDRSSNSDKKKADIIDSVSLSDDFQSEVASRSRVAVEEGSTLSETLNDDFLPSSKMEIKATAAESLSDDFLMESRSEDRQPLNQKDKSLIVSTLSVLDDIDTEATELSPVSISEQSSEFQGTLEEDAGRQDKDDLDIPIPVIPKSLQRHVKHGSEEKKGKKTEERSRGRAKRHALQPKEDENRGTRHTKVKLAISKAFDVPAKFEQDEEEVFVDDLSVSEIDSHDQKAEPTKLDIQQRHLTFTPVVVQKDIKPKKKKKKKHHNHTEMTPNVPDVSRTRTRIPDCYSQTPQPQRQRGTSISFSRTILGGSTLVPNAAEMIDQNFINTIHSARQQLAHIRESIYSSRRTRAMRESGTSSFDYTQNPFSSVAYP